MSNGFQLIKNPHQFSTGIFLATCLLLVCISTFDTYIKSNYQKAKEQSKIHHLIKDPLFIKIVEEHNKNHVHHKVNIETITSEEINAILNPCTVWDYRERNKCNGQFKFNLPPLYFY